MKKGKSAIWTGAALLAAVFIACMLKSGEQPPPAPAVEPDLFSFVKPLPATAAGTDRQDARAAVRQQQAEPNAVPEMPMDVTKVQQTARKMRSEGASEDDIYRMRAAALSAQAANELQRMERDEAAWKSRVDAYLAEREQLINGYPDGVRRQGALQQLRQTRFSAEEQALLSAYETSNVPQLVQE